MHCFPGFWYFGKDVVVASTDQIAVIGAIVGDPRVTGSKVVHFTVEHCQGDWRVFNEQSKQFRAFA
jgi:hypothetical protein